MRSLKALSLRGMVSFVAPLALGAVLVTLWTSERPTRAATDHRYINSPGRTDHNPYSNAVLAGDTLYLAGSIGLDPKTGKAPDSVEQEVRNVMDGMKQRLEAEGMTMDDVVWVQIFCPDLSLYDKFNAVYRTYFKEDRFPARAFVGSGTLLAGGHFEVMATAVKR
jgi:2-iminobutanoate/2-iminopropanoate deaminase